MHVKMSNKLASKKSTGAEPKPSNPTPIMMLVENNDVFDSVSQCLTVKTH